MATNVLELKQSTAALMVRSRSEMLTNKLLVNNSVNQMNANNAAVKASQEKRNQLFLLKKILDEKIQALQMKKNAYINNGGVALTEAEEKEYDKLLRLIGEKLLDIEQLITTQNNLKALNSQLQSILNTAYYVKTDDKGNYYLEKDENGKERYKTPVNENVLVILLKLLNGLSVTDELMQLLAAYRTDGFYDKARQQYLEKMSSGYVYNIARTWNDKLYDIRNYNNFRSSISDDYLTNGNFTKTVQGGGTCPSRSFYMSKNDFLWSLNYNLQYDKDGSQLLKSSVQNIILNEYQPIFGYSLGQKLVGVLVGTVQGLVNAFITDTSLGSLANEGMQIAANTMANKELNKLSKNPGLLYDLLKYNDQLNPMKYIESLFNNGQWLNTYLLPFVNNGKNCTLYLDNGSSAGRWNIGGIKSGTDFGDMGVAMTQQGINTSIPTTPTFDVGNPEEVRKNRLQISFDLINKNDLWLSKNFEFMQALFAGSQWLQMTAGVIIGSNVYHVLVPGRFVINWASITTSWTTKGRLKTNKYMVTKYNSNLTDAKNIKSIDLDTLWPDAWHLDLTIDPLSQWNFNTHISYYKNGFGAKQQKRLASIRGNLANNKIPGLVDPSAAKLVVNEKGQYTSEMMQQNLDEIQAAIDQMNKDGKKAISEEMLAKMREMQRMFDQKRAEIQSATEAAFIRLKNQWLLVNETASDELRKAYLADWQARKQNEINNLKDSDLFNRMLNVNQRITDTLNNFGNG